MKARGPYHSERHCPLCGGAATRLVRPLRYALFDDLGVSGDSPLVACRRCGMTYNDVCGGREALQRYYAGNAHYLAAATAGSGGSSPAEHARYRRLLGRVQADIAPDTAILDVGCGKGGLLAYLAQHGYRRLSGIEPSQACRDAATCAATIVADVGDLPDNLRPGLVVVSHVLEHLHDPATLLRALVQIATDDAVFYIETPNADILPDLAFPWAEMYFEHINHFDASFLAALAGVSGLGVLDRGENSFLPGNGDSRECIYLICQRQSEGDTKAPSTVVSDLADRLDGALPIEPPGGNAMTELASHDGKIALWGVSQYAMLLLGSQSEIAARLVALYDASTAKQGRNIAGILIRDPSHIADLRASDLLLLPRSTYTTAMVAQLPMLGFAGQFRIL